MLFCVWPGNTFFLCLCVPLFCRSWVSQPQFRRGVPRLVSCGNLRVATFSPPQFFSFLFESGRAHDSPPHTMSRVKNWSSFRSSFPILFCPHRQFFPPQPASWFSHSDSSFYPLPTDVPFLSRPLSFVAPFTVFVSVHDKSLYFS